MRTYRELPGRAPQALRVEWLLSSAETERWPGAGGAQQGQRGCFLWFAGRWRHRHSAEEVSGLRGERRGPRS